MKDYRVTVKARNNRIISAVESSGGTLGQKWCASNGLVYGAINGFVNMTLSPLNEDGSLRVQAQKLCDVLGMLPDELWSAEQVRPLERNWTELEFDKKQIEALLPSVEDTALMLIEKTDMQIAVQNAMSKLSEREEIVLKERFFNERTLEEIGCILGVNKERVRQIEAKALRKLRHTKNDDLRDYGYGL